MKKYGLLFVLALGLAQAPAQLLCMDEEEGGSWFKTLPVIGNAAAYLLSYGIQAGSVAAPIAFSYYTYSKNLWVRVGLGAAHTVGALVCSGIARGACHLLEGLGTDEEANDEFKDNGLSYAYWRKASFIITGAIPHIAHAGIYGSRDWKRITAKKVVRVPLLEQLGLFLGLSQPKPVVLPRFSLMQKKLMVGVGNGIQTVFGAGVSLYGNWF